MTQSELDTVTAGAVLVGVEATATAVSDTNTRTSTRTMARIISNPVVEVGTGVGVAHACCGSDTDATVSTYSSGDGTRVVKRSTEFTSSNPVHAVAVEAVTVVSITPPTQ